MTAYEPAYAPTYEPGDTVSIKITGKIARSEGYSTSTLRFYRQGYTPPPGTLDAQLPGAIPSVDLVFHLEPGAKVEIEHTSKYKNGVHIDSDGNYWMRRPDGWYPMNIENAPIRNVPWSDDRAAFVPKGVQRLKEDR